MDFFGSAGRVVMEDIEIDAGDPIDRCRRGREAFGLNESSLSDEWIAELRRAARVVDTPEDRGCEGSRSPRTDRQGYEARQWGRDG